MKHKKLLAVCTVIFSIIVCLGTFILLWFWADEYPDFADFTPGVDIPGLDDGAVPQGLCSYYSYTYDDEGSPAGGNQSYFFISAYMKKGPSRIYVTGSKTGYIGYVTMKFKDAGNSSADADGNVVYYGHAGGVATSCKRDESNGTFWMASEGLVFCMKGSSEPQTYKNAAEEIIAKARLDEGNEIVFTEKFAANCNASFCYFFEDRTTSTANDKLYVGEFYHPTNAQYSTDEGHHITTKSGKQQNAFVYEYTSSTSTKYGLTLISDSTGVAEENRVPKIQAVYSVPEKIQGFARIPDGTGSTGGKFVLSQSWALADSKLFYYDYDTVHTSSNREKYGNLKKHTGSSGTEYSSEIGYLTAEKDENGNFKVLMSNKNQPVYENPDVYFMDDSVLAREYSIPSMAEGLCVVNNPDNKNDARVYVLFESGCYKYRMFVRQELKNVYYFIPRK